jgi:hypothetical protein
MLLMGLPEAANEFLRAYRSETGRPAENLGFWELAAAARPMDDPAAWELDRLNHGEILQQFIAEALTH